MSEKSEIPDHEESHFHGSEGFWEFGVGCGMIHCAAWQRAEFVGVSLMQGNIQINIPIESVKAICAKWKIREFALFGSVLRSDFGPKSDVDVLVSFQSGAGWSLWDLFDLQDELAVLFGRAVDLIEKEALRNPFRRSEILGTRRVLYAA
jgi:uncharacterized protein